MRVGASPTERKGAAQENPRDYWRMIISPPLRLRGQKGIMMEKFYVVEIINELTVTREDIHTEAVSAQEAVDAVMEKMGDMTNYSVLNVFVETEEIWH